MAPDLTLYFLNGSRAIRIAWLLEELALPYKLVASNRAPDGSSPPDFKAQIPTHLQASPTIKDGNLVVQESIAIVEYLCEVYDTASCLIPKKLETRTKVREWMAAAEGTFLLQGLAIFYPRMFAPNAAKQHLPALEENLSSPVRKSLDWLESELSNGPSGGEFLVGRDLSAADIMMGLSIEAILVWKLGTAEGKWPHVEKWLESIMQRDAYKRAIKKTGYRLDH